MKALKRCLPPIAILTLITQSVYGQLVLDANYIERQIVASSDQGAGDYKEYSEKLVETLSGFSAEQLANIFGEAVSVTPTLNELLDLEPIGFNGGSSVLLDKAKEELDKVFDFLSSLPNVRLRIEGHTHTTNHNSAELSEGRAQSSADYLVSKGIEADRLEVVGLEGSELIAPDGDPKNRRIEIEIIESIEE